MAFSIMPTAGPVVPIGKNMLGSESRQADNSLHPVTVSTVLLLAICEAVRCQDSLVNAFTSPFIWQAGIASGLGQA
jgi:hypothetical protein